MKDRTRVYPYALFLFGAANSNHSGKEFSY